MLLKIKYFKDYLNLIFISKFKLIIQKSSLVMLF